MGPLNIFEAWKLSVVFRVSYCSSSTSSGDGSVSCGCATDLRHCMSFNSTTNNNGSRLVITTAVTAETRISIPPLI
jgi:hypothetical protein